MSDRVCVLAYGIGGRSQSASSRRPRSVTVRAPPAVAHDHHEQLPALRRGAYCSRCCAARVGDPAASTG
ncbi:hypothetical protein LJR084_007353 [Variovorax sp. LjRoot84]